MPEPIQIHSKATAVATSGALRVALLYAGFAGLWILLSDQVMGVWFKDTGTMTRASMFKGWGFVAVTAILLFVMVNRLLWSSAHREAKLQALLHAIPDLVWLKDPQGVYLGCNAAFERYFGARETEILGRTDYDFVAKEAADFFREMDQGVLKAGGPRQNEEWITLAETGQRVLLETLKTPMFDKKGLLIGVLGIGRDITEQHKLTSERERLQARLHQAQKMELVGRFAGGLAHDYNNMLGVILANAELAAHRMAPDQPELELLNDIQKAARHSAELTGQLLAFAREQPLEPRLLDFDEAIPGMLGVLGRLAGPEVSIQFSPGSGGWNVRMDPTHLGQVLSNLVVNARDAMAGRGRIELATTHRTLTEADAADLVESHPGDYVCLSVADGGSGMAPDLVARIFEPFFTTKPAGKGTGLGLAMVHSLVTQNGGTIQVDSEPTRGTCFRILLPRVTSGASTDP